MKKNFLFFLVLALFFSSCKEKKSTKKRTNKSFNVVKIDNFTKYNVIELDDFIYDVKNVFLEKTEASFISDYRKVIIEDDLIYIWDNISEAIFCFTLEGKFLFVINNFGEGPTEYRNITDFYINKDDKVVGILDATKNSIKTYSSLDGSYKGDLTFLNKEVLAAGISYADEKYFVTVNNECEFVQLKTCYDFFVFDKKGALIYEDLAVPENLKYTSFRKSQFFSKSGENVFFNPLFNDTIYKYNKDGMSSKLVLDFGKHALSQKIKQKNTDVGELIQKYCINQNKTWGADFFNITKDYLHLFFVAGGKTYKALYSMNEDKGVLYPFFDSKKYHLGPIRGSYKDYFYSITSSEVINNFNLNYVNNKIDKDKFNERYELGKNITDKDNHIITLFKVKNLK